MAAGLGGSYRRLWTASAISNLGDGVGLVAAPLLAASLTRDPVLVAGWSVAYGIPWLLFPLLAGALVDRIDRRRAMGAANFLRAGALASLAAAVVLDLESLPLLYAAFFVMGTAETLYDNAAQSMVPAVVEREQLEKANGRLYAAEFINNQLAGRPVGAFLFGVAVAVPFLFSAGAYAASAALVLTLRGSATRSFVSKKASADDETYGSALVVSRVLSEIREGLGWLWRHRLLRTLALMVGATNLTFAATEAVLVLYAQDVLDLGAVGYGLIYTCVAVGGLVGSLASERVVGALGSGRTLFASLLMQALGFAAVVLVASPYATWAAYFVIGMTLVLWNVVTVSLRQAIVPEDLFGRVNSVYRLLAYGGLSAGAALGGLVARQFGLAATFWFAVLALAVLAAVALLRLGNGRLAAARETSST